MEQHRKVVHSKTFYVEAKTKDDDPESQNFFDQKIAAVVASQHDAQQNAMCMNSKVRQVVTDLCMKHNDSLAEKISRKRKSADKIASGSSAHSQEPKKKSKKVPDPSVEATSAQQETTPVRQATPPRQVSPQPLQPTPPKAPSPPKQPSPPDGFSPLVGYTKWKV